MYFHIVRDHKFHTERVMGGSFAIRKNSIIKSVSNILKFWKITPNYGNDQHFLAAMIYPRLFRKMLVHDRYEIHHLEAPFRVPFKVPIVDRLFVGQVHEYDEAGNEYLGFDP
jgi:hypothetical protein